MGLLESHARYFLKICKNNNISGKLLCLGRQDIFLRRKQFVSLMEVYGIGTADKEGYRIYDRELNDRVHYIVRNNLHLPQTPESQECGTISDTLFFTCAGFDVIDAIDISNHEGANIIFDLNKDNIGAVLSTTYDLVLDTGTLEHVFDIRNVFKQTFFAMKEGGYIINMLPSNNYCDHGFYQFSPGLLYDYYTANNFVLINIEFMRQVANLKKNGHFMDKLKSWESHEYKPGMLNHISFGGLDSSLYSVNMCAKKTPNSSWDVASQQSTYQAVWAEAEKKKNRSCASPFCSLILSDQHMRFTQSVSPGLKYIFRKGLSLIRRILYRG